MLANMIAHSDAVLFDFDGVIADSEPYFFKSYSRGFAKRGHTIDRDEYWDYWTCRGEGVAGEIKRHELPFTDADAAAIYAERRVAYSEFCRDGQIGLFEGMMDAVKALVDGGLPCAIASNSFPDDIHAILDHAGFGEPPCSVVGRLDGLGTKPKPDIFIYSAGLLKVVPARCLVVEDAQKGLDAAHAAGMRCAIIKTPYNEKIDFPEADLLLENHAAFVRGVNDWRSPSG